MIFHTQVARRNGALFENPTNLVYCQVLEAADLIKVNIKTLKDSNVCLLVCVPSQFPIICRCRNCCHKIRKLMVRNLTDFAADAAHK